MKNLFVDFFVILGFGYSLINGVREAIHERSKK